MNKEIVFNDFSLYGQYSDIDSFIDDLRKYTICLLDLMLEKGFSIVKRYDTYGILVTKDKSLRDVLFIKGNPHIQYIKKILVSLIKPEYWNENESTIKNIRYICNIYNDFYFPSCLTEAIYRNKVVFSFYDEQHLTNYIDVFEENNKISILNAYNLNIFLEWLLENNSIEINDYISKKLILKFDKCVSLKYAKLDFFNRDNYGFDEIKQVEKNLIFFIQCIQQQKDFSRFGDVVEGQYKYYEYRDTVNGNEYRIYIFFSKKKIYILNDYIKKKNSIPLHVKRNSLDIIKRIISDADI